MGNQVDELELYQYDSLLRHRRFGDLTTDYHADQASSITRTRGFGSGATVGYSIDQAESLVRTRTVDGGPTTWVSGTYITDPIEDTEPGYVFLVRDFGDPTKLVFSVNTSGDILGKTVTITQDAATDVALTILSDAAASNATVFKVVNPSGTDVFRMRENGAIVTTQQIDMKNAMADSNPKATLALASLKFGAGGASVLDCSLSRKGANNIEFDETTVTVSNIGKTVELELNNDGFIRMQEITAPTAPVTDKLKLYAVDNGSGKTQLAVRFATGAVQVLATEP